MTIALLFLLVVLIVITVWAFDQRSKRREAEDDAVLARTRADILADHVPFPRGVKLP